MDWQVEERPVGIDELVEWCGCPSAEAALAGTAAILGGVGTLIVKGEEYTVGSGQTLRSMFTEIQTGRRAFTFR